MKQRGIAPVLIVVIIALVFGGFLIYQKQFKNISPVQKAVQSSPKADESVNPGLIGASWKTYSFTDFSLKLPAGWTTYKVSNPVQLVNYSVPETGSEFSEAVDQGKLKIEIYSQNSGQALNDYVAKQKAQAIESRRKDWVWNESSLSVDKQPAVKVKSSSPGYIVFVQNPQKTTILIIAFTLDFDNQKELSDQILSTFKFLSKNLPISTQTPKPSPTNSNIDLDIVRGSDQRSVIWENQDLGLKLTVPQWVESRYVNGKNPDGTFVYSAWSRATPKFKDQQLSFGGAVFNGVSVVTGVMMERNEVIPFGSKYQGKTIDEVAKELLIGAGFCATGWHSSKDQCPNPNQFCYTKDDVLKNLVIKRSAKFASYTAQLRTINADFSLENDCRSEDSTLWLVQAKNNNIVLTTINPENTIVRLEEL